MEELTKLLSDFDAAMASDNPENSVPFTNGFEMCFRLSYLRQYPRAAFAVYQHYCQVGEKLPPERRKLFQKAFTVVLKFFLSNDYQDCPFFYQQKEGDITLPYASWEEEVSEIVGDGGYDDVRRIEESYYDRCFKCRKSQRGCSNCIIQPVENGPYWRRSEYELRDEPVAPADEPSKKETRQQKAAKTKKEKTTEAIKGILRPLCEKMLEGSMVEKADDGINYKLLKNSQLYAYIALRVTQESTKGTIPWKAISGILAPPEGADNLKVDASKYKNGKQPPKGADRINMYLREIMSTNR